MHLVHIIPRMQLAAVYGAPPVDFLPQQDPVAYEQLVAEAERFVAARFLTLMQGLQPEPVAHIIKVRLTCTCQATSLWGIELNDGPRHAGAATRLSCA